jgi:hypothetical protein
MQNLYNIDRKTASRLLSVSLRTIDRYLATGRLSHVKNSGRVWLSKTEIVQLYKELVETDNDKISGSLWHDDNVDNSNDNVVFAETRNKGNTFTDKEGNDTDSQIYKSLYIDTKEKLDQVTFRIGQLETQLSSMIPVLEFQKQQRLLQETTFSYQQKIQETESRSKQLMSRIEEREVMIKEKDKEIESERFNKAVIATVLFFILFLQPVLWILLR